MTHLPRPSLRDQRRLTRLMQVFLVGIVAYGVAFSQPKAITNASMALLITFLPAVMERRYDLPLDPWLGLWITLAVFLHTVGSAGLYVQIGWWDHVTHAMSASLVAGVGYTFARAVDIHSDEIYFPHRFFFVYVLVVVLSFGVVWELFEFGLDVVRDVTGIEMPVSQHGLDDTVRDLVFNSIGALLVAALGQAHLSDVAEIVRDRFTAPE